MGRTIKTIIVAGAIAIGSLATGNADAQSVGWVRNRAAAALSATTTNPLNTANGAALQQPITATFSQSLDPATVSDRSFTLTGPRGSLSGTVTVKGNTASFAPAMPLTFNTDYTATVTTAIRDTAGNSLAADHVWRFNTGKKLAAGAGHTCARLDDGPVKCWGYNGSGVLGLGDTSWRGDAPNEMGNNLPAVDLGAGRTAVQIVAGGDHACARLDNGGIKCWGYNRYGQLGLGDTSGNNAWIGDQPGEMGDNLPVVALGLGRTAVELAAGESHTCARLDNGQIKCWGRNDLGQLGLGDTSNRGDGPNEMGDNLPEVALGAGRTAVEVASGQGPHTCARLDDGQIKCWGYNRYGQLGLGDMNNRGDVLSEMGDLLPPVNLGTASPVRPFMALQLALGTSQTCARLVDAVFALHPPLVKCWGIGDRLGLGGTDNRGDQPGEMGNNLPAVSLGTNSFGNLVVLEVAAQGHTCVRFDDGRIKCWGFNDAGELGLGDRSDRGDGPNEMGNSLPFVDLGSGRTALEVAVGGFHTCAHLDDDSVKCWGLNNVGQLGRGDTSGNNVRIGDQPGEMGDNLPTVDLGSSIPDTNSP